MSHTGNTEEENGNTVTLDLRVSCNTFWKYEMKLRVNRDEYVDPDNNNLNINGCCHEKKNSHIFQVGTVHL
jgi:hypothetical protein